MQKERLLVSGVFSVLTVFGLLNLHSFGWLALLFLYLLPVALGLHAFRRGWINW